MRRTIHKYPLTIGRTVHEMPAGADVLTAQDQYGTLTLWASVDLINQRARRFFDVYGTGHALPADPGKYIATVQMRDGLVWHVFEAYETADGTVQ